MKKLKSLNYIIEEIKERSKNHDNRTGAILFFIFMYLSPILLAGIGIYNIMIRPWPEGLMMGVITLLVSICMGYKDYFKKD